MANSTNIIANDLDGIIERIAQDYASGINLNDYHINCQVDNHYIKIDISSSPGGGEEGGYETTGIQARLLSHTPFNFVLYPEDFIISIGKLFGLQDIELGYPEFDKNIIVKTNDADKLKNVLAGEGARKILQNMSGFALKLEGDDNSNILDLSIQRALTDINELNQVLAMFYEILTLVDKEKVLKTPVM